MPLAPLHQPDGMITQVREACGPGRVRRNAACSLSSHLQCENLLLDLLALGDKCIYCRVGIGARMINVRPLPFLDQFLDVGSQPIISCALHWSISPRFSFSATSVSISRVLAVNLHWSSSISFSTSLIDLPFPPERISPQ